MKNISKAYAKAFTSLGNDQKVDVASEFVKLTEVINISNDLENLFFLDVFTNEEKLAVFSDIAVKISLHKIVQDMVKYLVQENRINLLPLITKEIIVIDDEVKGFLRGTIEGASDSVDDETLVKLKKMLKEKLGKEPELTYKKNSKITAGYRLTVDDYQVDATLDNQLEQFKQSILGD